MQVLKTELRGHTMALCVIYWVPAVIRLLAQMPKKTNIWVVQTQTKSKPNAEIKHFCLIFGQKELWRDLVDHTQQWEFG